MKRKVIYLIVFLSVFGFISCDSNKDGKLPADAIQNPMSASDSNSVGELPAFQFVKTEHDFGKIVDGVKVSFKYKFTNVGKSPLIITDVRTTCGCTASTWSREPVEPGQSGFVELSFDSSNRKGPNHKMATVIANTQPNSVSLSFVAEVVDAADL